MIYTTPMPPAAPAAQPVPPRYRWLKRFALLALLGLALLLAARLAWGQVWKSRFDDRLQAIRDRGEPIDLADFNPPPIDDADNAAVYLQQALQAWPTIPGDSRVITDHEWYSQYDDQNPVPDPIPDNAAYLAACEPALALLEQAADASVCDWGHTYTSPLVNTLLGSQMGEMRRLAWLMDDAAQRAIDANQPALAWRMTSRVYTLSEAFQSPPVLAIEHLVGLTLRAVAFGMIEIHLPALTSAKADSAEINELRRLLNELQDEDAIRHAHHQAYLFERIFIQDTVSAVIDGRLPLSALSYSSTPPTTFDAVSDWLRKPLIFRDGCLSLEHLSDVAEAAATGTIAGFDEMDVHLTTLHEDFDKRPWLYPLADDMLSNVSGPHFKYLTNQRLARAAVALKLYAFDRGQPAATLDQLVPDYLAAVPTDPMDPDGGPIRYRPQGAKLVFVEHHWLTDEQVRALESNPPPIVYSVGDNRADDGGVLVIDQDGVPHDTARYRTDDYGYGPTDHWFLLTAAPDPVPDPTPGYGTPGGYGSYGGYAP